MCMMYMLQHNVEVKDNHLGVVARDLIGATHKASKTNTFLFPWAMLPASQADFWVPHPLQSHSHYSGDFRTQGQDKRKKSFLSSLESIKHFRLFWEKLTKMPKLLLAGCLGAVVCYTSTYPDIYLKGSHEMKGMSGKGRKESNSCLIFHHSDFINTLIFQHFQSFQ